MAQSRSLPTFFMLGLMFLLILLTYSTDILSGMQGLQFLARDRSSLVVEADVLSSYVPGSKPRPHAPSISDSTAVKVGNTLLTHPATTSRPAQTMPSNVVHTHPATTSRPAQTMPSNVVHTHPATTSRPAQTIPSNVVHTHPATTSRPAQTMPSNVVHTHPATTSRPAQTMPSNVVHTQMSSPKSSLSVISMPTSGRAAPSAAVTTATRRSTATSAMPPSSHSTIKTISKNTSLECGKLKELLPKLGSTIADDSNKAKVPKSVVTLVTAYYTVPSRHPRQHYMQWFKLFFLKIRTPIAFYTNCETLTVGDDIIAILLEREKMFPGRLLVRTMELEDPPLAQKFASVMKAQAARDPELSLGHNYRLSMIWLMKTDAMMAAIRENRFSSEWFLWVDAGAFRNEHRMKDWPSPERLAKLPKDRVLYELVYPFPRQNQMKGVSPQAPDFANWLQNHSILYYQDHVAAGFIGLNTKNDFHLKFYNTLTSVYQLMADHNLLIVKEQNVFNLMFLMYPQMFAAIQSSWQCGDGWFHVEPWLASQEEYPCKAIAPLLTIT